jgi:peptidoglycan/LPS O-acetylase OafA/YrhL
VCVVLLFALCGMWDDDDDDDDGPAQQKQRWLVVLLFCLLYLVPFWWKLDDLPSNPVTNTNTCVEK